MKITSNVKAEALAKLVRLQKSTKYRSFFNAAPIDAFAKVEGSAFARKSHEGSEQEIQIP
ncbi:hypothetical protein D3C76_1820760 [compost metagenome]